MKINEEFEIDTEQANGYILTRKIGQYTTKPKNGSQGEVKTKTETFYLPSIGGCLKTIIDLSAQKVDTAEKLMEKINKIENDFSEFKHVLSKGGKILDLR